jgi:glycosyltransferase involved in cell wall biosynthesis
VVLAVCKLHDRESPLLVVEGFAELRRRLPLARLLFVGDGPLRREVQKRVALLGVTSDVTLTGYVPYHELAAYYGAADAFVHVPRREPWGISVGEAMACRVPVVASTSVGAAADLVIDGRTGFLIGPDDPGALAEALLRLAQGATARDAGARARQLVERIDVGRAAEQLEVLLTRLRSPAQSTSMSSVVREDFLNRWGRWSA